MREPASAGFLVLVNGYSDVSGDDNVPSGRLALHDLDDAERLASRALDDALPRRGIVLDYHRHEDALAYLVAVIWQASVDFDPDRCSSFSNYAYQLCRRRSIDWIRADLGRSKWAFSTHVHERERPQLVSFDGPGGHRLDIADGGGEGDFEAGGLDLRRVLAE